jgi:site-specific DNA-methyltransferase (adenine-specific)
MDAAVTAAFVSKTRWESVEHIEFPTSSTKNRPSLPENDNEPGAPERLLAANRHWRNHFWPSPFERATHVVKTGDARSLSFLKDSSVHLVVTSPPYFNLKPYHSDCLGNQLGRLEDYEQFLIELDRAWAECLRVLVPGGRVCCVIGDILVPRKVDGRHRILPLPADIMLRSRRSVSIR